MVECFECCCDRFCVDLCVSNPRAVAKNDPLYWSSKSFADEECYIISADSKLEKTFVHRQPNGVQTLRRLAHVKRHEPNRSETSGPVP